MNIEVTISIASINFVPVTVQSPGYTATIQLATSTGGGTWGSITGTLADQLDLQAALDANAAALAAHEADVANPHAVTLEQARTAGSVLSGDINVNNNRLRNIPDAIASDEPVTKSQFDAEINTIGRLRGGIDCSLNPNYPAGIAGDRWEVTAPGKIGGAAGVIVAVWDEVVCRADTPAGDEATVGASWYTVQGNVDRASETVEGISRAATQAETNAEIEPFVFVSPLKLGQWLTNVMTRAMAWTGIHSFSKSTDHTINNVGNVSGAINLDLSKPVTRIVLTGNTTITPTNAPTGTNFRTGRLLVYQDGTTGGWTLTAAAGTARGTIYQNMPANSKTTIGWDYSAIDGKIEYTCNTDTVTN